jgi:hypothetical protein
MHEKEEVRSTFFMETTNHREHGMSRSLSQEGFLKKLLTILLTILSVLLIIAIIWKVFLVRPSARDIKGKEYQAVFLTNGQVYFGKLSRVDDRYVKLNNIYYLQTQQTVQPGTNQQQQQQQPQLSLAKLGSELHGPEDAMYVNKDQVLFWENLKDDGKVVKAIKDYQASGNK